MMKKLRPAVKHLFDPVMYTVVGWVVVLTLENYVHSKSLQRYLADQLPTMSFTFVALMIAMVGLILTQTTNLRAVERTDEEQGVIANVLTKINVVLRMTIVEGLIMVLLSFVVLALSKGQWMHLWDWSWFAVDIANVALFAWMMHMIWDMASAQMRVYGDLSTVVFKAVKIHRRVNEGASTSINDAAK
jgi:hypothetical protein